MTNFRIQLPQENGVNAFIAEAFNALAQGTWSDTLGANAVLAKRSRASRDEIRHILIAEFSAAEMESGSQPAPLGEVAVHKEVSSVEVLRGLHEYSTCTMEPRRHASRAREELTVSRLG